jgi:L-iditol 2-dehydrogenase
MTQDSLSLPTSMQAIRYHGIRQLQLATVPVPTVKLGEVLVKLGAALTCGTDLKCYRRGHPVLLKELPSPFGHEGAGTIVALGSGVTTFRVGDRVSFGNSAPCGLCFYCQKQQPQLCDSLELLNGTYADYLTLPAQIVQRNTYKIPDSLPFRHAAFAEPLAVSLRAVEACQLQAGDSVALIGLGPIGQLIAYVLTHQGMQVTAMARSASKRQLAETWAGVSSTVSIADGLDVASVKATYSPKGRGFDAVIEAVGLPELWEASVGLVRRGGLVNWFAGCASGSQITLDTRRLHYDEIRLVSPFHHTPVLMQASLDWLTSGRLNPEALLTDTVALPQVESALKRMEAGEALKIAIEF